MILALLASGTAFIFREQFSESSGFLICLFGPPILLNVALYLHLRAVVHRLVASRSGGYSGT